MTARHRRTTQGAGDDALEKMRAGTRARLERVGRFASGVSAAIWRNQADLAALEQPTGHILSLYLAGGQETRRVDRRSGYGGPGKGCFLPSGHRSVWEVRSEMRFLHLYFDVDALASEAARALDADIRDLAGRELIYFEDPALVGDMAALARLDWAEPAERIRVADHAHRLAEACARRGFGLEPRRGARGGLAPAARRRVLDFVETALDQPIGIAELAEIAGRSSWHFAKTFRESLGVSPYAYVKRRRMTKALRLLRETDPPVGEVAADCGYASPTRFAAEVKAAFGAPPSAIRAALGRA